MASYANVLEMIGDTPMIELKQMETGPCRLFAKLEAMNPGGSIKDRIGLFMIEAAEARGEIKPGDTLIEATAGNTGIGLALAAAQKGYRLVLVIPDKMSQEKIFNLRAMGADVMLTRSDVGKGHAEYYQDMAARIAAETGAYFINQFANPDNVRAHEETTAPEIWEQMEHDVDAIVLGVGSSGTLTGVSNFFARVSPETEIVLADPAGSVLADYIRTGELGDKGSWLVEGVGEDFIPSICDLSRVKSAYSIGDKEAFSVAREVLRKEGLLLGSSSGTLISAALRYCREQSKPKRVVTLGCDTGNKYLSKMYNDYWLIDQGLLEREATGDLRDLIGRPHAERAAVAVGPGDILSTAHARMRNHGYSQLPVVEGERLLGGITELDIMHAVLDKPDGFSLPAREVMNAGFPRIEIKAPFDSLTTLLGMETAVAAMDGDRFLGLITRTDILNYLSRRA